MATNEIKPFCGDGTVANGDVLDLTEYENDTQRLTGNQAGIARRDLVNTVLRQVSHVAAGLSQFVANRAAAGVHDDGDLDALEAALATAIASLVPDVDPVPAATTEVAGKVELLTNAEAITGMDTSRAATAAAIKAVLDARGLWQYTASVALPVDFNALTGSRPYFVNVNAGNTNSPDGTASSSWYVVALGAAVGFQVQLAIPASPTQNALYVRKCVEGVWSAWEAVVTNYNGVVSQVGSCSSVGTWTLTNLAIGRPVFLTYASSTNTSLLMYYRILTGAANCAENLTSYYSTLGAHDQNTSMSNVGIVIPIATTVTIDVVQISGITVTARQ